MKKNIKISVLGAGLWGSVLAHYLSRGRREVWLWEFSAEAADALKRSRRHPHIPEFKLDGAVRVTSSLAEAALDADVLLFVLPSQFVRSTAKALAPFLRGQRPIIVSASKGIEPKTLKTMGEIIASEVPALAARVYTFSGPSFAREVARGVPTKMVFAGRPGPEAEKARRLFDEGAIRAQWSADRKGVELGGSLKNVLAIGCGVLDGLKAGANTKAALIIQGMAEMGSLIERCGGKAETIYGLAGLGDLIATGTSAESRNRAFGEKLGQGKSFKQAMREIPTVVEGAEAAISAHEICRKMRLKAPLLEAIWKVVHDGASAELVVEALGF